MGTILRARDTNAHRDVAMKALLRADTESPAAKRFIREARIVASLEHPNIIPVHDIGTSPLDEPYFTMKWFQGENLTEILIKIRKGVRDESEKYDLESLLEILIKVCNGVAFAHSKRFVHLDLKPHNILVGDFGEVVVLDWGLAVALDRHCQPHFDDDNASFQGNESSSILKNSLITRDGTIKGTPGFMAPEQANGKIKEIDERSDIFSLGSILYMILTLKFPIVGEDPSEILRHTVNGNFVPPGKRTQSSSVPKELEAVVMKAMALKKEDRYDSVKNFQADIMAYLRGYATSVGSAGVTKQFFLLLRRRKSESILIGTSFLIISVLILVFFTKLNFLVKQAEREKEVNKTILEKVLTAKSQAQESQKFAEKQQARVTHAINMADFNEYIANLRLSELSLQQYRYNIAVDSLKNCPSALRNWEWGRLKYLTQLDSLTIPISELVLPVDFSTNGNSIVFLDSQGRISIKNLTLGDVVNLPRSSRSKISSLAISNNETRIIAGGLDNSVELWDVETRKIIRLYLGHSSPVSALEFSGDGNRIATASWDGSIILWDAVNGDRIRVIGGDGNRINSMSLDSEGTFLATSGLDNSIKLWDMRSGTEELNLTGHKSPITSVDYNRPNNILVSASDGGIIKIWDTQKGELRREIFTEMGSLNSVALSNRGEFLVAGGNSFFCRIWETRSGDIKRTLKGHSGAIISLQISKDDERVLTASNDQTIKLWSLQDPNQEIYSFKNQNRSIRSISIDPTDKFIAVGSQDQMIRIFSLESGLEVQAYKDFQGNLNGVEFGANGEEIISVDNQNTATIWKIGTGRSRLILKGHTGPIIGIDNSNNSRKVITGSFDNTARIWDSVSGRLLHQLEHHQTPVRYVCIGTNGKIAVTSGEDDSTIIWDVETGNPLRYLPPSQEKITALSLNSDETLLIVGTSTGLITTVGVPSGILLRQMNGHLGKINTIEVFSDNSRIVSGSDDMTAKLWHTETGMELATLKAHTGAVNAIAISSDSRQIFTAGADGQTIVWKALDWME